MADSVVFDHLAVAVEHSVDGWRRYAGDLGGAWVAGGESFGFAPSQVRFANGMKIEVLQPFAVERNDFLRRFLDRRGPGAHHVTFKVPDLPAKLDELAAAGFAVTGTDLDDPHWLETFVHPKAAGIVVQVVQADDEWDAPPPEGFPSPKRPPSDLVRVEHTPPDIARAHELFGAILEGVPDAAGDYAWSGPGRLRLTGGEPGTTVVFAVTEPATFPAARRDGGRWIVDASDNYGVRLVLEPR